MSSAAFSAENVSIKLSHSFDEDAEYDGAFEDISVDILYTGEKVGTIAATLVDRQKIPERLFLAAMVSHSEELQLVGVCLFEPRYGRTKLQSLVDCDDPEFLFMYISKFHIDSRYKSGGVSDVGTEALRQLLHHPYIRGDLPNGRWKVCSAVYILDPMEALPSDEKDSYESYMGEDRQSLYVEPTPEHKQAGKKWKARLEVLARLDANQFLRNGFFQDLAIAKGGDTGSRILVASYGHWTRPLITHAVATKIAFYQPPPESADPTKEDAELLTTVMEMIEETSYGPPTPIDATLLLKCRLLVQSGGAKVATSGALSAACVNNAVAVANFLLDLEITAINALDPHSKLTPLMYAARNTAGRKTRSGIPESRLIDSLLARGALKDLQDPNTGMTAYGHFKKRIADNDVAIHAMTGGAVVPRPCPSVLDLEMKLIPPGGPTPADLTGGEGADAGFVDYSKDKLSIQQRERGGNDAGDD